MPSSQDMYQAYSTAPGAHMWPQPLTS